MQAGRNDGRDQGLCQVVVARPRVSTIRYAVTGPRDAPALVLLHALGANRRMWDACTTALSQQFAVVACDLRGAGDSPAAGRPWTPEDHARDVEAVRAELGLDRVIPVGCAVGSVLAAWYAHRYPHRVKALVLCEPPLRIGQSDGALIAERIAAIRQRGMESLVPAAIDRAFDGLPKDERYEAYTRIFLSHDPIGYASIAEGLIGVNLRTALREIRVPTLVVVGKHDVIFTPEVAKQVHQLLQLSELKVLATAAHFPPFQDPAGFARAVLDFLSEQRLEVGAQDAPTPEKHLQP